MANRVDKIVADVLFKVGQKGEHAFTRNGVLDELQSIYEEISDVFKAYKVSGTIALVAGTNTYAIPASVAKIRAFITPEGWRRPLEIIENPDEWDRYSSRIVPSAQPLKGYAWAGQLSVWPVPVEDATLGYLAYGNPTVALAFGADPVTDKRWDYVMMVGVLARLTGDGKRQAEYLDRAETAKYETWKETFAGILRHEHSSDRIGF